MIIQNYNDYRLFMLVKWFNVGLSDWGLTLNQDPISILTLRSLSLSIKIFSYLKLCLATAIHNFKWLEIYVICET